MIEIYAKSVSIKKVEKEEGKLSGNEDDFPTQNKNRIENELSYFMYHHHPWMKIESSCHKLKIKTM